MYFGDTSMTFLQVLHSNRSINRKPSRVWLQTLLSGVKRLQFLFRTLVSLAKSETAKQSRKTVLDIFECYSVHVCRGKYGTV